MDGIDISSGTGVDEVTAANGEGGFTEAQLEEEFAKFFLESEAMDFVFDDDDE